jgi:hypothetical protein
VQFGRCVAKFQNNPLPTYSMHRIKWDKVGFSETGAIFYQTTRRRILKAHKFQTEMLPIILCVILKNPSFVFRYIFVNSP